jgi:cbb3-type cytochrome c oxidase subunit III
VRLLLEAAAAAFRRLLQSLSSLTYKTKQGVRMNRLSKSVVMLQMLAGIGAVAGWAGLAAAADASAKPDLNRGQAIATQVCASCHGADGNSAGGAFPKLAGQHAAYIVKQLNNFKTQPGAKGPERKSDVMAPFANALSSQDVVNVAAYFESQKEKPGFAHDKALVAAGQKIWRGGIAEKGVPACAGCHGPTGAGIPSQYPQLAGQWSDYTVAQLSAFAQGTRANSQPMSQIASRLNEHEIKAVADYINGLR